MSAQAPASPPGAEPAPARRITDTETGPRTVIGPGTRIKGQISGGDSVEIEGTLEGESRITGLYRVGRKARVTGDVTATSIIVDGEVAGHILVAEKVEIGAAARVRANVKAQVVAIAEGAFFDGQVHMEGRSGPAAPTAFREKRRNRRHHERQGPSQR
jgi:cytoskeletal protein CcmA (bactofilin family)